MSAPEHDDPRAKWRTLPESARPAELVAELAVEPVPGAILYDEQRTHQRQASTGF